MAISAELAVRNIRLCVVATDDQDRRGFPDFGSMMRYDAPCEESFALHWVEFGSVALQRGRKLRHRR
jgi:hypothetical protein